MTLSMTTSLPPTISVVLGGVCLPTTFIEEIFPVVTVDEFGHQTWRAWFKGWKNGGFREGGGKCLSRKDCRDDDCGGFDSEESHGKVLKVLAC